MSSDYADQKVQELKQVLDMTYGAEEPIKEEPEWSRPVLSDWAYDDARRQLRWQFTKKLLRLIIFLCLVGAVICIVSDYYQRHVKPKPAPAIQEK